MTHNLNNKKELEDYLKKIQVATGKIPRTIDLQNQIKGPKYKDYVHTFGSWKQALIEAGFDVKRRTFKKYKK